MAGTDRDSMRRLAGADCCRCALLFRLSQLALPVADRRLAGSRHGLGTRIDRSHGWPFEHSLVGVRGHAHWHRRLRRIWVARFDEERKAGRDFDEAMQHTAMHAGPSIVTAALTTSLAFYATMLADFQAVSELGFIAGSGVLLCALACLMLIPALQAILNRRRQFANVADFVRNRTLDEPIPHEIGYIRRSPSRPMLVKAARRPVVVILLAAAIAAVRRAAGIRRSL